MACKQRRVTLANSIRTGIIGLALILSQIAVTSWADGSLLFERSKKCHSELADVDAKIELLDEATMKLALKGAAIPIGNRLERSNLNSEANWRSIICVGYDNDLAKGTGSNEAEEQVWDELIAECHEVVSKMKGVGQENSNEYQIALAKCRILEKR